MTCENFEVAPLVWRVLVVWVTVPLKGAYTVSSAGSRPHPLPRMPWLNTSSGIFSRGIAVPAKGVHTVSGALCVLMDAGAADLVLVYKCGQKKLNNL